jgi:transposase
MTKGQFAEEFKQEAVELTKSSEKTISQIETDLGIPHGLLNKWKRHLAQEGTDAFRGHGQLSSSEAELRQLRQENELLRQEREILKKALAIFTRSQR